MDIVCLGELLVDMFPFHFGSLSLTEEPSRGATMEAVKVAREAGVLISFDVNYRPSLWSDADKAYDRIVATRSSPACSASS